MLKLLCVVGLLGCGGLAESGVQDVAQNAEALSVGEGNSAVHGWANNDPARGRCVTTSGSYTCILPDPADGYVAKVNGASLTTISQALPASWGAEAFNSAWSYEALYWEDVGPFDFQTGSTGTTATIVLNQNLGSACDQGQWISVSSVVRVTCPGAVTLAESPAQAAAFKKCTDFYVEIDIGDFQCWVDSWSGASGNPNTPAAYWRQQSLKKLALKIQGLIQGVGSVAGNDTAMGQIFYWFTEPASASPLQVCMLNAYSPSGSGTTLTVNQNVCD